MIRLKDFLNVLEDNENIEIVNTNLNKDGDCIIFNGIKRDCTYCDVEKVLDSCVTNAWVKYDAVLRIEIEGGL